MKKICLSILFLIQLTSQDVLHAKSCNINLTGYTDKNMLDKIKKINCKNPQILISSSGGEEKISLLIAKEIEKRSATLIVENVCLSACAEYILPSAFKVKLNKKALIGFHRNPINASSTHETL